MAFVVGTSGWSDFRSEKDPLRDYSHIFDAVEVDTTFYNIPSNGIIDSWKRSGGPDMQFTVKANQIITHDENFSNTNLAVLALSRTYSVARLLKAEGVIFECKRNIELTIEKAEDITTLLMRVRAPCKLFFDIHKPISEEIETILGVAGLQPVLNPIESGDWDAGPESPYIRISGRNGRAYQLDDEELENLLRMAKERDETTVIFTGPRKYVDAGRFQVLSKTGKLISTTSKIGESSIITAMKITDRDLPMDREHLCDRFGGLIFDLDEDIRARMDEYLSALPKDSYDTVADLQRDLAGVLDGGRT